MNWLDKLSGGKPLKSRKYPLPIGIVISDNDLINNFAHEIPSKSKSLSGTQVKKIHKDLMSRGYSAKNAKKYSNNAYTLSKKYMNKSKFPGQNNFYGVFDFDGDGVPNRIDCFPFDKKRQRAIYNSITGETQYTSNSGQSFATKAEADAANIRLANPRAFNPNLNDYNSAVNIRIRASYEALLGGGNLSPTPKPTPIYSGNTSNIDWNKVTYGEIKASGYKNKSEWKAAVAAGTANPPNVVIDDSGLQTYEPEPTLEPIYDGFDQVGYKAEYDRILEAKMDNKALNDILEGKIAVPKGQYEAELAAAVAKKAIEDRRLQSKINKKAMAVDLAGVTQWNRRAIQKAEDQFNTIDEGITGKYNKIYDASYDVYKKKVEDITTKDFNARNAAAIKEAESKKDKYERWRNSN